MTSLVNPEIQRLAVECTHSTHFDVAKFAELIVTRCAGIAWENHNERTCQEMLQLFGLDPFQA